ncbi:MAG: bifunctional 4-hydroxy-2-oxoglutarate aldolase/2-dehydro-3-deoxy-phosphogluconate aldolase [Anditalea sp.]
MNFNHNQIITDMENTGIIPVFNHSDVETAKNVLDASYRAGIKVFEFTNRGEYSLEVFQELAAHARKYEDLVLGIGTIFTVEDTRRFLEAGADFVVSPAFVAPVGVYCNSQQVLWIPGCGTVTEIYNATELGAQLIKVFPGNVLGPSFVSAVKAVFPDIQLMPTGGVEPSEKNLQEWFSAGVICVGMGSQLFKKEWIQDKAFTVLQDQIAQTLHLIEEIKNKS